MCLQHVKFDPLEVWEGLRHAQDPPTPLERLAHHLFSIIANSASCERLFSTYGNILTDRRTRMATQTLTSLAELRMHLRDLHFQQKATKSRLRRQFGTVEQAEASESTGGAVGGELISEGAAPEGETGSEGDAVPWHSMHTEAERLMRLAAEEDAGSGGLGDFEDEDVAQHSAGSSTGREVMSLEDLFDFENEFWVQRHTKSSTAGLEEELELYQLLDFDDHGNQDSDVVPDDI